MENEKHILCVGEASVEFVALEKDSPLSQVHTFTKQVAGEAGLAMRIAKNRQHVAFLGKVGEDGFGKTICENLEKAQVDFSAVSIDSSYETAASFCAYRTDGSLIERQYVNIGADHYLQEKDVGLRVLEKVGLVHFSSYGLLSESGKCVTSLLTWCLKKAISVSFALREDCCLFKSALREAVNQYLGFANFLFLRSEQASQLTGFTFVPFAIKALFRDNPRLEEVVVREGDFLRLFTIEGEVISQQISYDEEQNFLAYYLAFICQNYLFRYHQKERFLLTVRKIREKNNVENT